MDLPMLTDSRSWPEPLTLGRLRWDRSQLRDVILPAGTRLQAVESKSLLADVPSCAAHATAAGKALLAPLPRPAQKQHLAQNGMPMFTTKTTTTPEALEKRLHPDENGIWSAEGEYSEDVVVPEDNSREAISCPI